MWLICNGHYNACGIWMPRKWNNEAKTYAWGGKSSPSIAQRSLSDDAKRLLLSGLNDAYVCEWDLMYHAMLNLVIMMYEQYVLNLPKQSL